MNNKFILFFISCIVSFLVLYLQQNAFKIGISAFTKTNEFDKILRKGPSLETKLVLSTPHVTSLTSIQRTTTKHTKTSKSTNVFSPTTKTINTTTKIFKLTTAIIKPTAKLKPTATKFKPTTAIPPQCRDWAEPNWNKSIIPIIKLRSDKFLYPAVMWGPNNQISGLQQTIFLAIKLNRTLVLPVMFSHWLHDTSGNFPTYQRIDVDRLRSFMSVISLEEFRKKCKSKFDVAFMSHEPNKKVMQQLTTVTKMELFLNRKNSDSSAVLIAEGKILNSTKEPFIPAYPLPPLIPTFATYLSQKTDELRKVFPSQSSCAVHISPFKAIVNKARGGLAGPLDEKFTANFVLSEVPDDVLYSACLYYVQHPRPVVEMARNYLREISRNQSSIAIHWRYDARDWQHQKCKESNVRYSSMCEKVVQITPDDVVNAAIEKSTYLLRELNRTMDDVSVIYLATPPTLTKSFIPEFTEIASKLLPKVKIASQLQLKKYIEGYSKHCIDSWQSDTEFLSLVEMEICKMSDIFFFSPGSSWSTFSLLRKRKLKGFAKPTSFSIFELASKQSVKRLSLNKAKTKVI